MFKAPCPLPKRIIYILANLAGVLLLALVITLVFFQNYEEGWREFMISYTWALVICCTQWFGNSSIYRLLDKKFSWRDQLVKRAIYGSLALIAYSSLAFMLVQIMMYKIFTGTLPENALYWGLRSSGVAILISFLVSLFFVAVGFFQNWKESLLEAERFKAEMLQYRYESLQNQINPHFLFNSFNVLSDLVYADQKKAVDFIRQLSQLFRYVLDSRDKELVPLYEEMEFIEAYAYLLKTRFGDKLAIEQDLKAEEEEMIVPMTLQLLLENSVKHNEISASQPLQIRISRSGDYLRVENGLQLKSTGTPSTNTGLSNLKQQYRYFTDKEIRIHQSEDRFCVEVPLIKTEKE